MALATLGVSMLLFTLWAASRISALIVYDDAIYAQIGASGHSLKPLLSESLETLLVEGFFVFKNPLLLSLIALGCIGFVSMLWMTLGTFIRATQPVALAPPEDGSL